METKHEYTLSGLHPRERFGLLFALTVVCLIAFFSYRGWTAPSRQSDQLDRAKRIVSGISTLGLSLTDAETGQRGFLLTGDDEYLVPYLQARASIPMLLKSLETMSQAYPDQTRRIQTLGPLVDDKLQELEQTIALRKRDGFQSALAVVRTNRGKAAMQGVRHICSEIQTAAVARMDQYSEESRARGKEGGLISILGGASLFLLLIVSTSVIHRGAERRLSLIGRLQQSERRLEDLAVAAEAANRAKSTFLSTMSHEIRTPMNAIQGYVQLMLRDPDVGPEAKTNLKIIGRSGEHLLTLINDVLDMSRIEAGRTELTPLTFNLSRLLNDLAALFRLRAEAKALRFVMLVDGESVPYISADQSKIRQSLINLLGNAIKFTERGQVSLHVTLVQRSDTRLWLSALVGDTGSGITDEELKSLFEPFSQTKRTLGRQEGTGLGLAISRNYARLMGGDVTVVSSSGMGSTFRFEIPVERGDAGVAVRRNEPRRVVGIHAGTAVFRILVVDDQLENRDWMMQLLTAVGFSVRGAENGEAAVRDWAEWKPQLILMDVHMPVMDGLEATRRIKAAPGGQETAIVVLTASVLDDDRRTVSQCGANAFLSKPCREDELLEKMRVLLNLSYDYEEMADTEGQPHAASLTAEGIGQLPRDLAEELREATATGDKALLDKLIIKVGATHAEAANGLQELADRYDYAALTRLLGKRPSAEAEAQKTLS